MISLDAYSVDGVRRLEELGVTDVIVGFRWPYGVGQDTEPLQTKIDNLPASPTTSSPRSAEGPGERTT